VPKPASKPAVPLAGAQDTRSLLPSAPDFWITRSCFRPSDERVSCRNERWRRYALNPTGGAPRIWPRMTVGPAERKQMLKRVMAFGLTAGLAAAVLRAGRNAGSTKPDTDNVTSFTLAVTTQPYELATF